MSATGTHVGALDELAAEEISGYPASLREEPRARSAPVDYEMEDEWSAAFRWRTPADESE